MYHPCLGTGFKIIRVHPQFYNKTVQNPYKKIYIIILANKAYLFKWERNLPEQSAEKDELE